MKLKLIFLVIGLAGPGCPMLPLPPLPPPPLPGLPHGHAKCEVPAERRLQIARKTARPLAVAEFEKFLSVANQALRENGPDLAQATLSGVEDNQTNRPNENPTKHKTSSKDQLC